MGLRKTQQTSTHETVPLTSDFQPEQGEDLPQLIAEFAELEADKRRTVAKALRHHPEHYTDVVKLILNDDDDHVRQSLFDSLSVLSRDQHAPTAEVLEILEQSLSTQDAKARSQTIRFLASQPEAMAPRMPALLGNQDSDLRLYALDMIQQMTHPEVPVWLRTCLREELHPNVALSVIDRCVACGLKDLVPEIEALAGRFPAVPMVQFSIDMAITRLNGVR